jgi:hypothetical protein
MGKNLEKFMWQVMQYLGVGTLHNREDGTLVYSAPCTCGDPYCGDEVILKKDRLVWTRMWGSGDYWDRWVFYEDGDFDYVGTVTEQEGFRYPPVVPA